MDLMIWPGALVTLIGLVGVIWCAANVAKARKQGLSDDDMRARLQKIVVWNMLALICSVIGLMMVVVGVLLG